MVLLKQTMDHLPAGPILVLFQLATSRCFDGGDGGGIGGRGNSIGLPGEGLHGLGRWSSDRRLEDVHSRWNGESVVMPSPAKRQLNNMDRKTLFSCARAFSSTSLRSPSLELAAACNNAMSCSCLAASRISSLPMIPCARCSSFKKSLMGFVWLIKVSNSAASTLKRSSSSRALSKAAS